MNDPLVLIIVIVVISIVMALSWYYHKEQKELKDVEFKIIAAENNLLYSADGDRFGAHLKRARLLSGDLMPKMNTMLTQHHDGFKTHIFNASHVRGMGKSKERVELIGLAVEFETVTLPRFALKRRTMVDGISFHDNMVQVGNKQQPKWLERKYRLFFQRRGDREEVLQLMSGKQALRNHIAQPSFRLLTGAGQTLVYYVAGELQPNINFYCPLEDKALRLARIFARPVVDNQTDEIKVLKEKASR